MQVLVIAPHPDDETLGVGGIICRHVADGDHVHLVVMTETYPPVWPERDKVRRQAEVREAADVLGIASVAFAGFPTMKLNTVPAIDLASYLIARVREHGPEVIYAPPFGDVNQDHDAVFKATLVASRPLAGCSVRTLYSYEVAPTTRFANPADAGRWQPNTYVNITDHMDAKLEAMTRYASELREPPHPRSLEGIRLFARERGLAVGVPYAETLTLIRDLH